MSCRADDDQVSSLEIHYSNSAVFLSTTLVASMMADECDTDQSLVDALKLGSTTLND